MAGGYRLTVNGIGFQGPEGLYQSLKFPRLLQVQRRIASRRSPDEAVRAAYQAAGFRDGWWRRIRVKAMMYTQAVRLHQHPGRFSEAFLDTGDLPIVEVSRQDSFWCAQPQPGKGSVLRGRTMLGRILTELRDELKRQDGDAVRAAGIFLEGTNTGGLLIDGKPLPGLQSDSGSP